MWQEAAKAYLEQLPQHLLKGTEKTIKTKLILVYAPAEI
jgi:hypothetical protein